MFVWECVLFYSEVENVCTFLLAKRLTKQTRHVLRAEDVACHSGYVIGYLHYEGRWIRQKKAMMTPDGQLYCNYNDK